MRKALLIVSIAAAALVGCGGKAPPSTFTDSRDGKVYRIVQIGSQVWMAENLNYAAEGSVCYGEGSSKVVTGWDKNDEPITTRLSNAKVQANCAKYGRLYNWATALTACPAGFHLPDYDEWKTLVDYADVEFIGGTKLKTSKGWKRFKGVPAGTDEYGFSALPGGMSGDGYFSYASDFGAWWSATEFAGTDEYGFSVLPGGMSGDGYINFAGDIGAWWSATEFNVRDAHNLEILHEYESLHTFASDKTFLFSVRCVQDDGKEKRK